MEGSDWRADNEDGAGLHGDFGRPDGSGDGLKMGQEREKIRILAAGWSTESSLSVSEATCGGDERLLHCHLLCDFSNTGQDSEVT